MGRNDEPEFEVGYKKPPLHSRFTPGKSGNPNGRPKKTKTTFSESIEKELSTLITVNEGGKRRRITKLQAIVKQQTSKALGGDLKAIALVMNAVAPRESEQNDNLSPILQAMRAIHADHESIAQNSSWRTEAFDQTEASADHCESHDGHN